MFWNNPLPNIVPWMGAKDFHSPLNGKSSISSKMKVVIL